MTKEVGIEISGYSEEREKLLPSITDEAACIKIEICLVCDASELHNLAGYTVDLAVCFHTQRVTAKSKACKIVR